MDQPYQPPASLPPEAPEKTPGKANLASVRFAFAGVFLIASGLMAFNGHYHSFREVLSKIPESEIPPWLRSIISGMHEERAVSGAMVVALIAWILSYTPLTNAARVLVFGALIFILPLGSIALYLISKSAP